MFSSRVAGFIFILFEKFLALSSHTEVIRIITEFFNLIRYSWKNKLCTSVWTFEYYIAQMSIRHHRENIQNVSLAVLSFVSETEIMSSSRRRNILHIDFHALLSTLFEMLEKNHIKTIKLVIARKDVYTYLDFVIIMAPFNRLIG